MRLVLSTRHPVRHGVAAGFVGAVLSGLPSTAWALVTGGDPSEAARAAGRAVAPRSRGTRLVAAAGTVHLSVSLGWGIALAAVLPRRHPVVWGAISGLGIAALDLGVVGRRLPAIRKLPPGPQIADHVAFGVVVGWVLARLDARTAE